MSNFKVGDLVYIPPFDDDIVYDINRSSYPILDITE